MRVPLSDGPLEDLNQIDSSFCTTDDHSLEAVAVDCSFANTEIKGNRLNSVNSCEVDSDMKCNNKKDNIKKELGGEKKKNAGFVLLILAGLTGGSGEGYVLDLVNSANDVGTVDTVETVKFNIIFLIDCLKETCIS